MFRLIFPCLLILGVAAAQDAKPAPPPSSASPSSSAAQRGAASEKSGAASDGSGAASEKTGAAGQKITPLAVTRAQRLGAAKTVFLRKVEGSDIPANVITNSLEGWGRYTLVSSPDKADLLIEISSPEEQGSSVTINGNRTNPLTGYPESMSSTSRNLSNAPIKMTVFDARTKLPLWSATEKPKSALKQKAREDNLVDAAEALFMNFHHAVEPTQP